MSITNDDSECCEEKQCSCADEPQVMDLGEAIDYYSQQPIQDEDGNNLTNADGANLIPDITIRFPDNRYLYIDAKYPDKALIKLKEDKDNKKYSNCNNYSSRHTRI